MGTDSRAEYAILGVFAEDVEVAVFAEDAGVFELIFGIKTSAAGVFRYDRGRKSHNQVLSIERGEKRAKAMNPPPDLVYRRLNFVNGVPREYHWATDDEARRKNGGHGIQRMTLATWRKAVLVEALLYVGRVGPCDQMVPRPKSRGGCDCPTCRAHRERAID